MGQRTVLLGDDDPPIRALLRTLLLRGGYTVVEARTGREVLEQLRTRKIDILLLDLMMPEVSGFEVIDQLRVERPEVLQRVIVVTALADKDLARLRSEDVFHVLRKPFDIRELLTVIEACSRAADERQS